MTATQRFYKGRSDQIFAMENTDYYGKIDGDGIIDPVTDKRGFFSRLWPF